MAESAKERARSQEGGWNDIEALLHTTVRENKAEPKVASAVL